MKDPSEWCAPMVPVMKKNGDVRITVDYKQLNKAVKRQQHMIPNLEDFAPKLAGSKILSSLDAAGGYYQIPIVAESSKYTTFMTPFGRYRFQRIPMGITMAPEVFQKKMEELLQDEDGCIVIMDDILIYGRDQEQHDRRLNSVLKKINASGLKLNKGKCKFRKSELPYFGHIVGEDGIRPNPERITAITNLAAPKNVEELRRCLGMINYLGRFLPSLSDTIKPLTELLREDTAWTWDEPQESAFQLVKQKVSQTPTLCFYQPDSETIVSADASSYGLGGVLLQRQSDRIVPIAFCSRTLSPAECQYAQIEKECLASVWACERFERYLIGLPEFELQTDHKPLVPLMTSKDLDQGPVRCQRLLIRMMRFNAKVRHVPGKHLLVADALSRSPLPHTEEDIKQAEAVSHYVATVTACLPASDPQLERIKSMTARDPLLQQTATYIVEGWPESVSLPMVPYEQVRAELSTTDGLILRGNRIVVPQILQREMIERIHEGHQGKAKCRERANDAVWWPGIGRDITNRVESCQECMRNKPAQQKEPLKPTPLPGRPWEKLGCDLAEYQRKQYLITYDYYSRWIDIKLLHSTTATAVISKLKDLFSNQGIPDVVQTDNGPQFSGTEFEEFAGHYGFRHATSSPYMSQANGGVERAVGIAKKILAQKNPELALLNYRSTPHSAIEISPAEALMGRKLRTRLPVHAASLKPQQQNHEKIEKSDAKAKENYKRHYDNRHGAKPLSNLSPGQAVFNETTD